MTEYMLYILEVLMLGTLYFQPSESRLFTGGVFILVIILHELIFSAYTGIVYYGSAALFYLAIMIITAGASHLTSLVLDIHKICLIAIIVNAVGWIVWYIYFPPNLYNFASVFLHAWGIWALMKRTGSKENEFRTDWGAIDFRPNADTWNKYFNSFKSKI